MPLKTVAILSPGDMGHDVGRALSQQGLDVITCLKGRSDRTRSLSEQAGIRDVGSLDRLVSEADLILSILVPAAAEDAAREVAAALQRAGRDTYFADCNAVSPRTAETIEEIIGDAGARFIDGSIIGEPPGRGIPPRVYVSGEHAAVMAQIAGEEIDVKSIGDQVGRASAIKMCYAGLTKGTFALYFAVLTAAESMGLSDELGSEFTFSQPEAHRRMERHLPALPVKASRWIAEMREIAATFQATGVTPFLHRGAADIYETLSKTPLAQETPENRNKHRTLAETIAAVAEFSIPEASVPNAD